MLSLRGAHRISFGSVLSLLIHNRDCREIVCNRCGERTGSRLAVSVLCYFRGLGRPPGDRLQSLRGAQGISCGDVPVEWVVACCGATLPMDASGGAVTVSTRLSHSWLLLFWGGQPGVDWCKGECLYGPDVALAAALGNAVRLEASQTAPRIP